MKTNIKPLIWALAALTLISCEDFLREEPASFISEDQYYKTREDAINAVNAVYFFLNSQPGQTPYNVLFNTGMNMAGDDEDPGPGATNPDVRSLSVLAHASTNLRVFEIWQQHYSAVKRANVALEKIPEIDFDETLKARLLGEVKALRALFYFNLVRLYGDVPLITEYQKFINAADYAVPRTASAEVYAQIEKDLLEAAAVLPASYSSPDVGRVTAGAAKALLAKVYLTKGSLPLNLPGNYAEAVKIAEEVISPADGGKGVYGYALQEDYSRVFLPAYKNNSEYVLSAQFKSNSMSQGNSENPRCIMSGVPGLPGNYAHMVRYYKKGDDPYFSIYKLYAQGDKRRDVTFVRNFTSPSNGRKYGIAFTNPLVPGDSVVFWNKLWDPDVLSTPGQSAANVHIIRYSDVLLIHAEAENELNGPTAKAYKSLNIVRKRAGLPDLEPGLSKDEFREAVYLDRRLELCFEYSRWFDLIRQKDASGKGILVRNLHEAGKTNTTEKNYLYPIPQSELDNNPLLTQNPGWE